MTTPTVPSGQIRATGVSPSTYGDDTHVAQITVNSEGQITNAVEVAISAAASNPGGDDKAIQFNDADTFGGVAPNVSTTRKFLIQVGDGGSADDPTLDVIAAGDIPATLNDVNVSKTFMLSGDVSPSQITADVNNYNPTNLSIATILRIYSDATRNVTGLAGGADGRVIRLENYGSFNITLKNQSGSSTAANRFALTADLVLTPNAVLELQYDSTTSRWYAIGMGIGGGSVPSGSDKMVQYNNGGVFGGIALNASATPKYLQQVSSGTPAFIQPSFTELLDTFDSFGGLGSHPVIVNAGATALDATFPFSQFAPALTDSESFISQSANITTTNFLNTVAGTFYRITYYLVTTSADLTAGALTVTFAWNDGTAARTKAESSLLLTSTGYQSGSEIIFLGSGNATYAVGHTGIFGTATYNLYVRLEQVG